MAETIAEELTKYRNILNEAWDTTMHTPKKDKGMWDSWSIADLKKELTRLKNKETKTEADKKREHQVVFAIRAKQKNKWGKISEAILNEHGEICRCGHDFAEHTLHGCMHGAHEGQKCDCSEFHKEVNESFVGDDESKLKDLVSEMGYETYDDFFQDNPGAIETVINWIREENVPEDEDYPNLKDEDEPVEEGKKCSKCGKVKCICKDKLSEAVNRVHVGSLYVYDPNGWDTLDPKTNLEKGDVVRVINVHGAPPANTMGHCFVGDPLTSKFIGLVSTGSLVPYKKSNVHESAAPFSKNGIMAKKLRK
ncbi:Uncharacterised protein [uncultured archaeon]|nr:Uncharacterised protein [uncultured archaeon]